MRTQYSLMTMLVTAMLASPPANAICQQGAESVKSSPETGGDCNSDRCQALQDFSSPFSAADAGPARESDSDTQPRLSIKRVFLNLPGDQKAIWTSPFHMRKHDSIWLAPLAGTTILLGVTDRHSMQRERSNANAVTSSNSIANGGLIGMAALPVFMYSWGSLRALPKFRETGLLSGEALVNAVVVDEALKVVFERDRPTLTDGQGKFFNSGPGNSSLPSTHSTLTWTVASVIAHEYPGWLTQTMVYGGAAAVSISRVTGRQHFPSDVVIGGAVGWLIGRQIYRAHHDADLDGAEYGAFTRPLGESEAERLGSPYVPLDSWVYPELKRLAALGYIRTQFTGLEPWTRRECLRQIEEAEYYTQDLPPDSAIAQTIAAIKAEFHDDGQYYQSAQIDSVYMRYGQISGVPLRDSYHFGQTIWNDYGRPYDQGSNVIIGSSARGVAGPFFFYVRGEYEHAPGRAALTDAQRNLIGSIDSNPVQPAAPVATTNRFYPLDMYAGVQLGQYALTFGKQSLWFGPGQSAPLTLGDNADPMYMLRFTRTTPLVLPGILKYLGQIRGEFLFSRLSGHQFPRGPFFNLQKISLHPTKNLELGFTRSSIWAGAGHPFTAHSLGKNLFTLADSTPGFGDRNDPGDRKSGFEFSYRVPGLRSWLTIYSDSYSDDDPSPLANPRRAAVNPGLYFSHLPALPKLDLRVEAVSTQSLTSLDRGGFFFYFNTQYHDANVNQGNLFGNPTGRDGRSYQAWSTYHFSAFTNLQFSFREVKASNVFLPGGGTQSDASTRFLWRVRPGWSVDAFVQYERWLIPALRSTVQQNVTGRVQLTFEPKWQIHSD
jgi:hypothetical protein